MTTVYVMNLAWEDQTGETPGKEARVLMVPKNPDDPCKILPLDMRLDLRNHSPTGFSWGYRGSGPAQLGLAICAHVLQDDARAVLVYPMLVDRVISRQPSSRWAITREAVLEAIGL